MLHKFVCRYIIVYYIDILCRYMMQIHFTKIAIKMVGIYGNVYDQSDRHLMSKYSLNRSNCNITEIFALWDKQSYHNVHTASKEKTHYTNTNCELIISLINLDKINFFLRFGGMWMLYTNISKQYKQFFSTNKYTNPNNVTWPYYMF